MARPTAKKHLTNNRTRQLAVGMAMQGQPFNRIADACRCDIKTLHKWLGADLEAARDKVVSAVAGSVVQIATESEDEGKRLDAAKFILKTQGGWKEEQSVSFKWDGDLRKLPTEQLVALMAR